LLLVNLHQRELVSWLNETLQIAISAARPADAPLPKIIDFKAVSNVKNLSWVVFENYIVANDRYSPFPLFCLTFAHRLTCHKTLRSNGEQGFAILFNLKMRLFGCFVLKIVPEHVRPVANIDVPRLA
jgi:hypothetical protein